MPSDRIRQTFLAPFTVGAEQRPPGAVSFDTWTAEPVGQVLIKSLRLSPLGMLVLAVLLVAAVHLLALAGFIVWDVVDDQPTDRSRRFVEWQFGEWSVVAMYWVAMPLLIAFYPWIMRASSSIYGQLWNDDVINGDQTEFRTLVRGSLRSMTNDVRWSYLAAVVAIFSEVFLVVNGLRGNWSNTPGIRGDIWLFYAVAAPLNMLGVYILTIMVFRYIATIRGLSSIFHRDGPLAIILRPWHPDRVGGLGALANYAVHISWFIAVAGLVLLLALYISAALRTDSASVWSNLEGIRSSLSNTPGLWLTIAVYLALSPLVFFLTLGSAHRAMAKAKGAQLRLLSDRLDVELRFIQQQLAVDDSPTSRSTVSAFSMSGIKDLAEVHELTRSFPVWPFDQTTIRRFGTAMGAPFIAIAVPLGVQLLITRTV